MAKRFTDSDIWKKQRWFKKLSPNEKLAFYYIKDQCTHWGMWNIDCIELMEDTGIEDFDLNVFIQSVNSEYDKITGKRINKKRLILLPDNRLWITGYLQFQWENKGGLLTLTAPAVRHGIHAILSSDLLNLSIDEGFIRVDEGFIRVDEGLTEIEQGLSKKQQIIDFILKASKALGSVKVGVDVLNLNSSENEKKSIGRKPQGNGILPKGIAQQLQANGVRK